MFTLNCNGRLLVLDKPAVMGIINITPDSFFSGSRVNESDAILRKAEQMLSEGAKILDIGGQSTRPGSNVVSAEEELQRVVRPVELIHRNFPEAFISVDTFYSLVARESVAAGAGIVNDISAGSIDPEMTGTVAKLGVPYVLMHMQGKPDSMQQEPHYENIAKEVLDFLISKLAEVRNAGIKDVVVDPGFGFGKTITHNFQLLHKMEIFGILECPVLLGISRKSTIYKTLNITTEEALNGTTVLHTVGILKGASILRVHDVKEAVETIGLLGAYQGAVS